MTVFIRLIEKITGQPHRYDNLARVTKAAQELKDELNQLSSVIRPYTESEDPLAALMLDMFNKKQLHGEYEKRTPDGRH